MRLLILLSILATGPSHAALIAYWNFNSLSIASAASPGSGGAPSSINATQGSGILNLSGWSGTVDDFGGTSTNAIHPDAAEESLSLIAGSGTAGNGSSITLEVSLIGMANPVLSFATQSTATGFSSNQLSWSINGTDFFDFGADYTPSASYALQSFDLSDINSLDGANSAYFRISFDGATGSTGNNRIDNIQLTAVPEPSTSLLWLAGVGTLILLRRR